ncbi:hypothetical protein PDESU_00303 [Pontiella desulfatans]|uniref:RapA2 cadherin-like domain-containing protein n=1 Tax=Pontiella desulfatans TaxID=2750659 RepID=A0A6C2TW15_PONDE|nr:Ig-like domain-containing protein [Pontiella desulfatans]VGO11757.1 hypothetical protein PDESU_00303 [Pontiella desulfatans]
MRERACKLGAVTLAVAAFGVVVVHADTFITYGKVDYPGAAEVVTVPAADAGFGDDANVSLAQTFSVSNAFSLGTIYIPYENDTGGSTADWSMTVRIFPVADVSASNVVASGADVYTNTFTFPYVGGSDTTAEINLTTPVVLAASVGTSGYALQITESSGGDFLPGWEWLRSSTADPYAGGDMYEDGTIKGTGTSARDLSIALAPPLPPTARDDEYILPAGSISTNVAAPGVLANDASYDSAILATNISSGSLTLNPDGSFSCSGLVNGLNTFSYAVVGGSVTSAPATVSLLVTLTEDPPTAVDDSYSMDFGLGDSNIVGNVLDNDINNSLVYGLSAMEDDYTVANGTLNVSTNGDFTYTPNAGFTGIETFTYKAYTPLATSVVATVTLTVEDNEPAREATLFDFNEGTEFDDKSYNVSMTRSNNLGEALTITTVDVIGQDGSSATNGVNNKTNIQSSSNSLGINSADDIWGVGSESRDFNPGEAWIISFDKDVVMNFIDLSSQGVDTEMTVSSSAFDDIVLLGTGDGSGGFTLGDVVVPAGTNVMFQMTSTTNAADWQLRIAELYVFSTNIVATTPYEDWMAEQGLTNGVNAAYGDDPDGDDMDNLLEYALGGNALLNDASTFLPGYAVAEDGSTNYLNYVYRRRIDYAARGMTYAVGAGGNLVHEPMTNATQQLPAGAIDADFESVTNRVSMDGKDAQFMELKVTID